MEHTIDLEATVRGQVEKVCDVLARQTYYPRYVQVDLGPTAVRQQVDVVLGPLEVHDGSVTQSIHIESVDHRQFFPTLDGELFALTMSEPEDTRICLTGCYQPPLGPAGAIGDLLVGRRLAEASIRAFFDELVSGIAREVETMQVGLKPAPTAWTLRD